MNELINVLQELATKIPGSKQAIELIDSKPLYLRNIINSNQSSVIKSSISSDEFCADMTQITLY